MFKKIFHSFARRYLSYSNSELRGSIILLVLLSLQVLILFLSRNMNTGSPERKITVIELGRSSTGTKENSRSNSGTDQITVSRSPFDPNTADMTTLIQQGFNRRIAQRIIKYRKAGGSFRNAEDLLKIYGLDQGLFEEIRPLIQFTKNPEGEIDKIREQYPPRKHSTFSPIELNQADSTELEALPLIGPKRASMIIRYRNILGGFVHKSQLLEVYSIDSTVFSVIKPKVEVDARLVQRIKINVIHADSLYHPYLSRKQTAMILRYRNNHGIFADMETVCRAALLNDKLCAKIAPYLTLD